MIEQMKYMKETLMNCVQGQLGDLASVDAEELGEAVDMIKDLSEAIYYCTITESMEKGEKEKGKEKETVMYYPMPMSMEYANQGGGQGQGGGGGSRNYRGMEYNMGRMSYDGATSYAQGGSGGGQGGNSGGGGGSRSYQDGNRQSEGESRNYPIEIRDYREGRSPMTRKTYMERKMHGGGKEVQVQELEKYMHELTNDIMEMLDGASVEEKQILQKKISALATKIV